jgi:TolB-like protein/DNA-binding winged helix-turn-helix (wHTH) protein/Flp pilus assembly protein TadD
MVQSGHRTGIAPNQGLAGRSPVESRDNSVKQIGVWRVDPALDEISRDGQTIKLEPKMMQLLLCLARHAGEVVSVEQLLDEVWKDVVVTSDSVYHAVSALRRVLGDNSKDPSYIANVMRRGYRLIAPVVRLGQAEAPAPPAESPHSAAGNQAVKPTVEVPQSQSIRKLTEHRLGMAVITVLAMALAYFVIDRLWISKRSRATEASAPIAQTANAPLTAAVAFTPPPHSIGVLPFVNISGDKEQEYFSDGLTEELLNSLSRIDGLQVAARTSSFSFREHPDIADVAHRLNVGTVLEGSVRRSGHTVRVTAQLINTVTGFHLWSKTYDRDLGDVLALQTEIATAVASSLEVTLLGDVGTKIGSGGTRNSAAFDAYLRGSQAYRMSHKTDLQTAIVAYSEAIQLDPNYALAFVGRSKALDELASWWVEGMAASAELYARAQADARKAVALAPDLGEAHLVLANSLAEQLDFIHASDEYQRALALAPGSALVLQDYGVFAVLMGRTEQGLSASRRAVVLDPLNRQAHLNLMDALMNARRPEEAISALHNALTLDPTYAVAQWVPYYMVGNYESARVMCESNLESSDSCMCLAMIYDKLGRHADAEAELRKFKVIDSDNWPAFAMIYAQWGDTARALSSLDAALRIRHVALEYLKTWPHFDPVRKEPRFQAIQRQLKFPPD